MNIYKIFKYTYIKNKHVKHTMLMNTNVNKNVNKINMYLCIYINI